MDFFNGYDFIKLQTIMLHLLVGIRNENRIHE
jgi:hypothetical protein